MKKCLGGLAGLLLSLSAFFTPKDSLSENKIWQTDPAKINILCEVKTNLEDPIQELARVSIEQYDSHLIGVYIGENPSFIGKNEAVLNNLETKLLLVCPKNSLKAAYFRSSLVRDSASETTIRSVEEINGRMVINYATKTPEGQVRISSRVTSKEKAKEVIASLGGSKGASKDSLDLEQNSFKLVEDVSRISSVDVSGVIKEKMLGFPPQELQGTFSNMFEVTDFYSLDISPFLGKARANEFLFDFKGKTSFEKPLIGVFASPSFFVDNVMGKSEDVFLALQLSDKVQQKGTLAFPFFVHPNTEKVILVGDTFIKDTSDPFWRNYAMRLSGPRVSDDNVAFLGGPGSMPVSYYSINQDSVAVADFKTGQRGFYTSRSGLSKKIEPLFEQPIVPKHFTMPFEFYTIEENGSVNFKHVAFSQKIQSQMGAQYCSTLNPSNGIPEVCFVFDGTFKVSKERVLIHNEGSDVYDGFRISDGNLYFVADKEFVDRIERPVEICFDIAISKDEFNNSHIFIKGDNHVHPFSKTDLNGIYIRPYKFESRFVLRRYGEDMPNFYASDWPSVPTEYFSARVTEEFSAGKSPFYSHEE